MKKDPKLENKEVFALVQSVEAISSKKAQEIKQKMREGTATGEETALYGHYCIVRGNLP